jgi:hypothetical protein
VKLLRYRGEVYPDGIQSRMRRLLGVGIVPAKVLRARPAPAGTMAATDTAPLPAGRTPSAPSASPSPPLVPPPPFPQPATFHWPASRLLHVLAVDDSGQVAKWTCDEEGLA